MGEGTTEPATRGGSPLSASRQKMSLPTVSFAPQSSAEASHLAVRGSCESSCVQGATR